jgi:hypothetical protein
MATWQAHPGGGTAVPGPCNLACSTGDLRAAEEHPGILCGPAGGQARRETAGARPPVSQGEAAASEPQIKG